MVAWNSHMIIFSSREVSLMAISRLSCVTGLRWNYISNLVSTLLVSKGLIRAHIIYRNFTKYFIASASFIILSGLNINF